MHFGTIPENIGGKLFPFEAPTTAAFLFTQPSCLAIKMISQKYRKVLHAVYERLMDLDSPWVITGSLGFALHGTDSPVSDIDLQTDREGAYKIQNAFRDQIVKNVAFSEARAIRSHFGELRILGVKVEIMGAVQKRLPSGEWESPVEVREHRGFVEFDGMKLPVLSLDYEEKAYRILGRIDKANMIKQWLTKSLERTTGSDEPLL